MNFAPVNAMISKNKPSRPLWIVLAVALLAASAAAGALVGPATASTEPLFVQGSHDYITATSIVYSTAGNFYGALNTTSGNIEYIRGYLASTGARSDYYKIELPQGKVLDVRMHTLNPNYVSFGGGARVSPDFELFTYAGIPSILTMVDWNAGPFNPNVFQTNNFNNEVWQENNILTPIKPQATYYINVSIWYGLGEYELFIEVSDPAPIVSGDYTGSLYPESAGAHLSDISGTADTRWYRFSATHDTANQIFQEASGWLTIDNWNSLVPYQVDAIIRMFGEDLGYSPDNPIGRPIEKSEAPNRETEPFSILAPYTGTYYIMLRITNFTRADYTLHFDLQSIPRFPEGGVYNVHKERDFDDTDWYWFNLTKGAGTQPSDRVVFNLSETSDDPLKPVNLNLWLFGYRDYFRPSGNTVDFDILNSSFQGDAPYNLTLNPEPRHEEVAAQAMYTGLYFLEVEDFNNTGNYSIVKSMDTSPTRAPSDFNNEPSQAEAIDWGVYTTWTFNQSEDHTDFYKITAKAGETIEVTFQMPNRNAPDGSVTNQSMGLVWLGIYQPGMQLLNWSWNYWFDFLNTTDHLENYTTVRATVAADGDYILEVTAMQDGYIGPFQVAPMRTLQVYWHMDWNFATRYTLWVSRLPQYNAQFEPPTIKAPLPTLVLNEDQSSVGVYNLSDYFADPDVLQGDRLGYTFSFSGMRNLSISEVNGLVTIVPDGNWSGLNTILVRATDLQRNYIQQYWNITVLPVNDAPYLVTNQSIRFNEDSGVQILSLISYVRDVDGDTLSFAQVADSNVTVSFTNTTIRITTVPDFQTTTLGGDYPVDVDVFDGTVTVRLRFLLNITNLLDAPRVGGAAPNITCNEDITCPTLDLNTIFYDPDDPQHKQPLNFLVSGNSEIGYDLFNGTLLLKPPADWSGAKTIQLQSIKFADGRPYPSDIVELNLIVREINDAPRITAWSPNPTQISVLEGAGKSFAVDATDPEHLQPKFRWFLDDVPLDTTLPTYSFLALYEMSRPGANVTYTLRAVADDGAGATTQHEWEVTVIDVPRAPGVEIAAPLEGIHGYYVGQAVRFFASAYDLDGDVLTFRWEDSVGNLLLSGASGNVTFPAKGTQRVILFVSDGDSTVQRTVNVTIEDPPQGPGFLPGFGLPAVLGAIGAVAAVGAVLARRRRGA